MLLDDLGGERGSKTFVVTDTQGRPIRSDRVNYLQNHNQTASTLSIWPSTIGQPSKNTTTAHDNFPGINKRGVFLPTGGSQGLASLIPFGRL